MQLCKAVPFHIRQGGGRSLVVSLPAETLAEVGEERWILRDEKTGTILLVSDKEFRKKYANEVGYNIKEGKTEA